MKSTYSPRMHPLNKDDIKKVIHVLNTKGFTLQEKTIVQLLMLGFRIKEITELKIRDITFANAQSRIEIRSEKALGFKTKTRFLDPSAENELKLMVGKRSKDEHLFSGIKGKLTLNDFETLFKKIKKFVDISSIRHLRYQKTDNYGPIDTKVLEKYLVG